MSAPFPTITPIYDAPAAETHMCTVLLHADPDYTKVPEGIPFTDNLLRAKSHVYGLVLLAEWLKHRDADIRRLLDDFNEDFTPKKPLTATTFNDLYKDTMMPTMRRLERMMGGNILETFQLELRDKGPGSLRNELKNPDGVLVKFIHESLMELEEREFDRHVFDEVLKGLREDLFNSCPDTVDKICGPTGAPRTLVDKGGVRPYNQHDTRTAADDDKVVIEFYYVETQKYEPDESPGIHIIKASGPLHKVTWLETTMMQCVYEAKLRYDLAKKNIPYSCWIYGALLRCAKSIAYTRLINTRYRITPALFTGRRTGGYAFLLLQNMFFADMFAQNAPPSVGGPAPITNSLLLTVNDKNATPALGTSSVDTWVELRRKNLPCLMPAGTHAHELQMLTAAVFPHLDYNPSNVPLSQAVAHWMYYNLTWKVIKDPFKGPMAMLTDTIGTRLFMKAANLVTVPVGDSRVPLSKTFQTARQDSGSLADFKTNMINFNYLQHDGKPYVVNGMPTTMMASEIDTTAKLLEAAQLGYASFGAGGFFGDSEKVWGEDCLGNSMAVKVVKVEYTSSLDYSGMPHIDQSKAPHIVAYAVKTGDPSSLLNTTLPSKFTIDRGLDAETAAAIKARVVEVRQSAITSLIVDSKGSMVPSVPIESIFDLETGPI